MVKVENAVRKVVDDLVVKGQPFNLDVVTRLLNDKSMDSESVEKAMLKTYFVGVVGPSGHTYDIFVVDGKMTFAPGNMKVQEVEKLLKSNTQITKKVVGKKVVANKASLQNKMQTALPKELNKNYVSDFYSPDSRGRVRIPVKLIRAIGLDLGQLATVLPVDDGFVVRANTKGLRKRNTYTVDRYGNLLFPVNDTSVNYRFSKVRDRVKVVPVTP